MIIGWERTGIGDIGWERAGIGYNWMGKDRNR